MEKTELDANIGHGNAPRKITGMKWNLRTIGAFAVLGTLALAASCRGFFVNPTITSLAIGPANLTLAPATSYQMVATATYSDGSTNTVTGQALWTSSNTSVANFTAPGLLAAGSLQSLGSSLPGTTTVSASDGAVSSATQTVNVCPTVESLQITANNSASSAAADAGTAVDFVATATFNGITGNQTVSGSVTWNISNTSVISSITPNGTSPATGTINSGEAGMSTTVTATLCGVTSSNTVTVTASS
jgi:trimeric autotransporter adhesin